jgi:hypothetical protein
MDKIIVEWYKHENKTIGTTELSAYGLQEAIDIVRRSNDYKVVCLGAQYKDKEVFINSINKLNGEAVLHKMQ